MTRRDTLGLLTVLIVAAGLLYFMMTTALTTLKENPLMSIPILITFGLIIYALLKGLFRSLKK
jgi:hypothetical protein